MDYVLCWLQQTLRAYDNPAVDAAIDLGNALGLPVLAYHGVRADYPHASDRLHAFLLGASRDMQRGLRDRNLRTASYVEQPGYVEKGLVYRLAERAAAVLTDDQPVFVARNQASRFAARCDKPVFAVDTARLVPTHVLPQRLATTPAFRKASSALRAGYEAHERDFKPNVDPYAGALCFRDCGLADMAADDLAALIAACDIDHSLPAVDAFEPTAAAAEAQLQCFANDALKNYAHRRNIASEENSVARLSPYLHFGIIGPRRVTEVIRATDVPAKAKWKFLDELLTWREYFHHQAFHTAAPDHFDEVPEKPRQSLLNHADDERPHLYLLSDLVHGRTDDETWNAAQRQWLLTGYMHNNLRMYWGKQILKWTRDPQTAWTTACYLNDRLSLDGRDPATYGNMKWVFGASKPGWKELPIYGWVPPKSDRGMRKREGMTEWLHKWANMDCPEIEVPDGLPHDIFRDVEAAETTV